jgi:aspartyl-tRNA(Asn)/glutamyl-tRNA(Gln) amidotransferase subunit B
MKAAIRKEMLELPSAKRARFLRDYQITPYDAGVLTATRTLADYFEEVVRAGAPPKVAANWIQTELLRRLNDAAKEISESPIAPAALAGLIRVVESGQITGATGKKVFAKMFETGGTPEKIIAAEGLAQISDSSEIERIAAEIIDKNPENLAKYRAGNEGVFKFFVGQVMRATRGQANPQLVNDILKRLLA